MTLRTAILCSLLPLAGGGALAQAPADRGVPLPPIAPIPLPERPSDPPARPVLIQAPRDGRSPFESPGPVLPERPSAPPRPIPTTDLPVGGRVTLAATAEQVIRFGPRYGTLNNATSEPQADPLDPTKKDVQRITYQGGLVIHIEYLGGAGAGGERPVRRVELAADNVVMWVKGVKTGFGLNDTLRVDKAADPSPDKKAAEAEAKRVTVQMYLGGNVVIRTRSDDTPAGGVGPSEQVFRAAEMYYDADLSKAVAVNADFETRLGGGLDPIHIRAREMHQLGRHELHTFDSTTFSSKRPADPVLTLTADHMTFTEEVKERRNIFGVVFRDPRTGRPDVSAERRLVAERPVTRLLGVPVLPLRRAEFELDEPLGPLQAIAYRSDRVYGLVQVYTSFDAYSLLGLRRPPGNDWLLHLDYLSDRGYGVGTDLTYRDTFGPAFKNAGEITAYAMSDKAPLDLLGGFRGPEPNKPYYRGRFQWTHNQDLYEAGTAFTRFHGQLAYQSDKNFLEQFYKLRFDQDPNPETFAYLYGGVGNFAWSGLAGVNVNRPWVTETQWLPRLDAALVGQSFFDTLVSTTRASAGYALFRPATQGPQPTQPGEQRAVDTLRADVSERLSLPFDLGPIRLEPYAVGRGTAYSAAADTGEGVGRLYGGGGLRASIPFSHLYPDVKSDLFNLRGLYHKVELRANYFAAASTVDHTRLPELDRQNDEVNDQSFRTFRRAGGNFLKDGVLFSDSPAGLALNSSPIFDPQRLANRRLLQNRAEAVDDMQAVQAEVHQRWQTKRGPSGGDHTVDVMALDLSATYFPDAKRDNFGQAFGLMEYNWVWNVGDRVSLTSAGWFDTFDQGTKYATVGVYYNRPDGSTFYLSYRQVEPIGSRVVQAVIGYQFSKKYAVSLTNTIDVSNNFSQGTTVAFIRTGTDLTMSIGVSYNSFQNNLGLQFLLVPNGGLFGRRGQGITNLFQ